MEHAEAHERLADLVLEPKALASLATDPSSEAAELLAHLARCPTCRAEFETWRLTHDSILSALDGSSPGTGTMDSWSDDPSLQAPGSLRAAVADIPRSTPSTRSAGQVATPIDGEPASRRPVTWWRRVAVVAATTGLVVAVGAGLVAVDQARLADTAREETGGLAALVSWTERILADPEHVSFALVGLDGVPAGSAAWSGGEYVITTTALAPPAPGTEYRCWVRRGAERTPIGVMRFADGTAYWWGNVELEQGFWRLGGQLGVSVETIGEEGVGPPILLGRLGG
jgi:hypothetical protein